MFSSAKFVAYTHENLAKAFALPGREHKDTREVVIVPAHFLLTEEADDLEMWRAGASGGVDEEVVVEGGDIEEDGLVVEKELREEGQILGEKLGDDSQRRLQ